MIELIDTPESIEGKGAAIVAAGKKGVIRYLSPNTPNFPHKRLTVAEVAEAAKHSLYLATIFEAMGDMSEMTPAIGKIHAPEAVRVAEAVGQPKGTGIGFAVDFDAGPAQYAAVRSYFQAVHEICDASGYLVTGYGDMCVLDRLQAEGLIHFRWRAGAGGWTGNRQVGDALINQTNAGNVSVAGLSVDLDALVGAAAADPAIAGFWLPKAA